jgi:serine/threonine-protein kinase
VINLTCSACGNVYPIREVNPQETYRCLACSGLLSASNPPLLIPDVIPSVSQLKAGSTLGPYTIVAERGRGGMGIVYEASGAEGRRVALKTLLVHSSAGTDEAATEERRFLREAKRCAGMAAHPHIVQILEGRVSGGTFFLVMELVDGQPLHHWRRDPATTLRDEVGLLRSVALAAHHAHLHGVVHRDLKPENILVDALGHPHVTDFGLSRILGESRGGSSTKSNEVVGTPPYVSPEQALKPRSVDYRTDIYAIGVMLYEALTGLLPFRGQSGIGMLMSILHDPVTPPRQTPRGRSNPQVDAKIEGICQKAMARRPEDRHPTAKVLAEELRHWLK